MLALTGQCYQGVLLSHVKSADRKYYDSLFSVSPLAHDYTCLVVALESSTPGQPLTLALYDANGHRTVPLRPGTQAGRENFLALAIQVVELYLHDRLRLAAPDKRNITTEEKPLSEFYPEPELRRKLHYHFAHRFLPAYVKSDPVRFFGYFHRGEHNGPTKFIQSRWQMMEEAFKIIPQNTMEKFVVRRVTDLKMWIYLPELPAIPAAASNVAPPLSSEIVQASSSFPMAIVQMPPRERMTHAYLVGIALVSNSGPEPGSRAEARVFTLERIEDNEAEGRFCEWTMTQNASKAEVTHHNYGLGLPIDRDEFKKAILSKIKHKPMANAVLDHQQDPTLDHALAEMLANPPLLPDPIFPRENYLQAFGLLRFRQILKELENEGLIASVRVSKANPQIVMLQTGSLGFWAIDFDVLDKEVSGRNEFISRVKEPIRRPPTEMAAFTAEQHIMSKGVMQIRIEKEPGNPGECQVPELKKIGWYVAALVTPGRF